MKKLKPLRLDFKDPYIQDVSRRITFLDIETSLVTAKVFRTGTQYVQASQLEDQTKILTVAYGSLSDLHNKGEKGVKCLTNRKSSTFKDDPHDDRELLEKLWPILDESDVIVAHNATFDKGWLLGRYLELGMQLPSHFFTFCTYQNLKPFNMTSKKLSELSQNLCGTDKIPTDFELWARCSRGEAKAFKEMESYNVGDVYDTLYKVWLKTAYYNPIKAIDFANPDSNDIQCKVDGQYVHEVVGKYYTNRNTGKKYQLYRNPRSGQVYRDRYILTSKNAGRGFIVPRR